MKTYLLTFFVYLLSVQTALPLFGQQTEAPPQVEWPQNQVPNQSPREPLYDRMPRSPTPIYPDEVYDSVPEPLKEPDNFQAKFFNMLFVLALLIGFMFLASRMLKRMMRNRVEQMNVASSIKVLETRPISNRSNLYLLDIRGQGVVIAESHNGVSQIASFPLKENEGNPPPATKNVP